MSAPRRRAVTAVGLGLIAGATACSLVLGLRDGTVVGSGADGGDDGGTIDDRSSPPPPDGPPTGFDGSAASCDGGLLPPMEDPDAVHVDPGTGADNLSCGGVTNPCKTLGKALTRVSVSPAKKIELAAGIYNESVTITNALGTITIEGGYDHSGSTWTGRCDETLVTVGNYDAGPPGTGTLHLGTSAKVTLRLFTVDTTLQPNSFGGSAHALVMETLANLTLENMDVLAQHGAPGATGGSGTTGSNSGCVSGSGISGTTGGPGDAGAYTSNGYVPASGQQGTNGDFGSNKAGSAGTPFTACTVNCGSPMGYGACNSPITIDGITEAGSPGCGGGPGSGGLAGQGGGASVAVVMLGSSTLTLKGVRFATAGGGAGGSGGPGGPGGNGTPGLNGASQNCFNGCNAVPFPTCGVPMGSSSSVPGGAGGPPGSDGGSGGLGGGGAGGPAHFIAQSPGATVNGLSEIKAGSANGKGGAGSGGAAAGPSSTVTTF